MKKLSLLMMLFALLLTACSDSENEDPNGGGGTNTSKIVGLNIKDAKLIYGVERSSAKSMLKSSGSSNYFRQITKGNKNMEVTWVTEKGDTTSIITIDAIVEKTDKLTPKRRRKMTIGKRLKLPPLKRFKLTP